VEEYLKSSDIKTLRESLLKEQDNICPLCGEFIPPEEAVLDHNHETGHIRQVLHARCNSYEGMILHKFKRSGVHKLTDIITFLLNLVKYWEQDYSNNLLHPTEKPKEPKISKRVFNKINKYYKKKYPKRKPLEYPKSGKWTKKLKEIKEEMENDEC